MDLQKDSEASPTTRQNKVLDNPSLVDVSKSASTNVWTNKSPENIRLENDRSEPTDVTTRVSAFSFHNRRRSRLRSIIRSSKLLLNQQRAVRNLNFSL